MTLNENRVFLLHDMTLNENRVFLLHDMTLNENRVYLLQSLWEHTFNQRPKLLIAS
jgi:hypothetical protein